MYCTTLHRQKRIVYGGLCLVLLIGLLLHCLSLAQEQEMWDEALVPWQRRKGAGRRYYHALVTRLCLLERRGAVSLCRLGLMVALLVWSGWWGQRSYCWVLLSLPLVDALLSLLPSYWPGVLRMRAYSHLVGGTHYLYRLTLVALFSTGLSSQREAAVALVMGGCVKIADGAWACGGIAADGTWWLEMEGHFIFTWKSSGFFEERILLVLLRQLRTPQSTAKRPFLRQEWHLSCTPKYRASRMVRHPSGVDQSLAEIRSPGRIGKAQGRIQQLGAEA